MRAGAAQSVQGRMVAIGERMVDLQIAQYEQHVRMTGDLVRLGAAALGGFMAAVGLLLAYAQPLGLIEITGLAVSVGLLVRGIGWQVQAFGGRRALLRLGPDMEALRALADADEADRSFAMSIAESLALLVAANAETLEALVLTRVSGFRTMVVAVILLLLTLLLTAGGRILA